MPSFAVAWEAEYPPEFGGGRGWVVSKDKCREAERERDEARAALRAARERIDTLYGEPGSNRLDRDLLAQIDAALGRTQTQEPASGVTVRFGDGERVPFEAAERAVHDEAQADTSAHSSGSDDAPV